jgi:hypothetical protein
VAQSGGTGGAIDSEGGTLTLRNSTLSNNLAENGGGLNADPGTQLLLEFTTIAANIASNQGGGLRASGGAVNSSLIGNNHAFVGPDAFGALDDVAHSLVSNLTGLAIDNSSFNFLNFDPLLLALDNNGGPSETHALMPASLAVGNADQVNCPATDQRGVLRTDACDIGAYENAPFPDEIFRDGFED